MKKTFEEMLAAFDGAWKEHHKGKSFVSEWRKACREGEWTDEDFDKELDQRNRAKVA